MLYAPPTGQGGWAFGARRSATFSGLAWGELRDRSKKTQNNKKSKIGKTTHESKIK